MTIRLETAARAAPVLTAAARRADADGNGRLSTREIHAAWRQNGAAATKALLEYHAQHRGLIRNDPELPQREKSAAMRFMDVEAIDWNTRQAQVQLGRIDSYRGNARRGIAPNTPDGVVTDAEIRNYGRTGGKLQMEARPFVAFVSTFEP
jgi:hypothetical protein